MTTVCVPAGTARTEQASGDDGGSDVDVAIDERFGIAVQNDAGDAAVAVERSTYIKVVGELTGVSDGYRVVHKAAALAKYLE